MNDFTKGNITKQLFIFAGPMLIGNLFQQLYSLVDAIIVGRFVSGDALAAVGVSMNITTFVTSLLIGLTTGSAVVISQYYGARQFDKLIASVSVSIVAMLGLSVLLTGFGVLMAPQILRMLDTDKLIFDDALLYLRIIMAGMVCPVFYNMYISYLRALGDSKRPLFILIFTVLLNAAMDYYFVVTLDMKIMGAAIATVISQLVAVGMCILYTHRFVPLLRVEKLLFDMELFKLILKYGIPAAIQNSLVTMANLVITKLINSFGPSAMAAITAVARIDALATMPVSTLSMALSTFVAQNMGAGIEERAKKGLRTGMAFMIICAVCMSALLIVFAPAIIDLFLDRGDANYKDIMDIGHEYLNTMVIFYFLFAFLFSYNGFFRGVGDAVIAMVFPVASLIIRTISAHIFVGAIGMGPEALAWSIPLGWLISGIASVIYFKKRLWVGKMAIGGIGTLGIEG